MEPLFSQSLNKDRTYLLTASSQSSPESIASTLGLAKSANLSASLIARTALSASYGRSGGGDTDSMSTTSRLEKRAKGFLKRAKAFKFSSSQMINEDFFKGKYVVTIVSKS